jgi:intein-encoded DNA endonuclease-like protein
MSVQDRLMERKEYITKSYESGISTVKLGKEFGCNPGSIYYFLYKNGIATRKLRQNRDVVANHKEEIIQKHSLNLTCGQIAKEIGFATSSVIMYANSIGLSFSHHSDLKNNVRLKDRLDEVIKLHNEGLSARKIGKIMGYNVKSIIRILRKNGFEIKDYIHEVDLNFFDAIDTEEKAYILGYWLADGNNQQNNKGIRIQICDKEILEKFKIALKYTGEIKYVKPRTERHQPQYLLLLSRKELSIALTKVGCPPNKTLTLDFPTEEMVPKHLHRHLVRGFFDGDGCIYEHKETNKWKIQILGTREFLCGVEGAAGIEGYWSKRFPERENNNHTWVIHKRDDVEKFLDWIYQDATIFLERKCNKYKEFKAYAEAKRQAKIQK